MDKKQIKQAMGLLAENTSWKIVREYLLEEIEQIKEKKEEDFDVDIDKFYLNEKSKYIAINFLIDTIKTIDGCKVRDVEKISWK